MKRAIRRYRSYSFSKKSLLEQLIEITVALREMTVRGAENADLLDYINSQFGMITNGNITSGFVNELIELDLAKIYNAAEKNNKVYSLLGLYLALLYLKVYCIYRVDGDTTNDLVNADDADEQSAQAIDQEDGNKIIMALRIEWLWCLALIKVKHYNYMKGYLDEIEQSLLMISKDKDFSANNFFYAVRETVAKFARNNINRTNINFINSNRVTAFFDELNRTFLYQYYAFFQKYGKSAELTQSPIQGFVRKANSDLCMAFLIALSDNQNYQNDKKGKKDKNASSLDSYSECASTLVGDNETGNEKLSVVCSLLVHIQIEAENITHECQRNDDDDDQQYAAKLILEIESNHLPPGKTIVDLIHSRVVSYSMLDQIFCLIDGSFAKANVDLAMTRRNFVVRNPHLHSRNVGTARASKPIEDGSTAGNADSNFGGEYSP